MQNVLDRNNSIFIIYFYVDVLLHYIIQKWDRNSSRDNRQLDKFFFQKNLFVSTPPSNPALAYTNQYHRRGGNNIHHAIHTSCSSMSQMNKKIQQNTTRKKTLCNASGSNLPSFLNAPTPEINNLDGIQFSKSASSDTDAVLHRYVYPVVYHFE